MSIPKSIQDYSRVFGNELGDRIVQMFPAPCISRVIRLRLAYRRYYGSRIPLRTVVAMSLG